MWTYYSEQVYLADLDERMNDLDKKDWMFFMLFKESFPNTNQIMYRIIVRKPRNRR